MTVSTAAPRPAGGGGPIRRGYLLNRLSGARLSGHAPFQEPGEESYDLRSMW
jgi:hypothetical protein